MAIRNENSKGSALRAAAKAAGILGADYTDQHTFLSKSSTEQRNKGMDALDGRGSESQIRLSLPEVSKQLAETLRRSGPATFRNIQDALGAETLADMQSTYGLTNVPQSLLKPGTEELKTSRQITTTGNMPDGDKTLVGFRRSLKESLTPEGVAQNAILREQNQEKLKESIESQMSERAGLAAAEAPKIPNLLERALSSIQGVGSNFFDRLTSGARPKPAEPQSTAMDIPETGEQLDFNEGSFAGQVDPAARQFEDQAALAMSNGVDAESIAEAQQALQAGESPEVVFQILNDLAAKAQTQRQTRDSADRRRA